MQAQQLYDWRDKEGLISGKDLHDLFFQIMNDPSPSGSREVSQVDIELVATTMPDGNYGGNPGEAALEVIKAFFPHRLRTVRALRDAFSTGTL